MKLYRLSYSYEYEEDEFDCTVIYSGSESVLIFASDVERAREIASLEKPDGKWEKATVEEFPTVEGIVDI